MPSQKVASAYVDLVLKTAEFRKATQDASGAMKEFANKSREETEKSREAVRLLNEDIGLHLPRGLQTLIAKLPAVTTAMNLAFDAVVVFALIHSVVEVTEKVSEFIKKNEEAAKKNKEAWENLNAPIDATNDKMQVTNDKLEEEIAKLEHKPANLLKTALDEVVESADALYRKLVQDNKAASDLIEKNQVGFWSQSVGGVSTADVTSTVTKQQQAVDVSADTRANNAREFARQLADPANASKERQKQIAADATKQWNTDTDALIKGLDTAAKILQGYYNDAKGLQDEATRQHAFTDYTNVLSISGGMAHNFQSRADSARLDRQNLTDTTLLDKDKAGKASADALAKARGEIWSEEFAHEKDVAAESQRISEAVNTTFQEQNKEKNEEIKQTETQERQAREAVIAGLRLHAEIASATYATERESASAAYQQQVENAKGLLQTGQISPGRSISKIQDALNQEHELQTKSFNQELDLYNDGSKEYQRVLKEKLKADADYFKEQSDLQREAQQNSIGAVFDELIRRSQDFNAQFKSLLTGTLTDVNNAVIHMLTNKPQAGEHPFKEAGKQVFTGVAKTGLETAEGSIMKAFGMAGKKTEVTGTVKLDPTTITALSAAIATGSVTGSAAGAVLGSGGSSSAAMTAVQIGLGFLGMAGGGVMSPGDFYLTGEKGPELLQVGSTSRINSARDTSAIFSSGGGTTHNWSIDARGSNDPAAVHMAVQRGIMQAAPHLISASNTAQKDSFSRKPRMKG